MEIHFSNFNTRNRKIYSMRGLYICSFDPESSTNSYFNEWAENFRLQHFEIFNSF